MAEKEQSADGAKQPSANREAFLRREALAAKEREYQRRLELHEAQRNPEASKPMTASTMSRPFGKLSKAYTRKKSRRKLSGLN